MAVTEVAQRNVRIEERPFRSPLWISAITLALLWLFYLSLSVVCEVFLGYQWDALLLETGFLAIFFAPLQFRPGLRCEASPSHTARVLAVVPVGPWARESAFLAR